MTRPAPADRRGFILIAVLLTSLLVASLGMIGLVRARRAVANRGATLHAAQARVLASSALQFGLARAGGESDWRAAFANDTEYPSGGAALDDGTISFKLVDPDGSLTNDYSEAATLYGIARVGDATVVRSISVNNVDQEGTLREGRFGVGATEITISPGASYGYYWTSDVQFRDEVAYQLTSAEFKLKRTSGTARTLRIEVCHADASNLPITSSVLGSVEVSTDTLSSSSFEWETYDFFDLPWVPATEGLCVTLEKPQAGADVVFQRYGKFANAESGVLTNTGGGWTFSETHYLLFEFKGKYRTADGIVGDFSTIAPAFLP